LELLFGCFLGRGGGLKKWLSKKNFLIFSKKYSKSEKNWWNRGGLLMLNRPLGLQITNSANDRDVLSGSLTRDYSLIGGLGAAVICRR
jgi:hypothetical protein